MIRTAQVGILALALVVGGFAVNLAASRAGAGAGTGNGFTSAAILPLPGDYFRVELRNYETGPRVYMVEVSLGTTALDSWTAIALRPGQSWERTAHAAPGDITVLVTRPGDRRPYRHLLLLHDLRARVDLGETSP
jgi:hypothetical protein